MVSSKLVRIFVTKSSRVFVSGLLSVITPIDLDLLGYPSIYIGMFLLVIVGSNVVSNVVLSRYERRFGRRSFLLLFSGLMAAAGLLLYLTTSTQIMLLAFFIGNISTTGTEAGPFQSIETGVLPSLVAPERTNRIFGAYNVVGYGAASAGALAASIPGYFQNSIQVFRLLYLFYGLVGLILLLLYIGLRDIEAPTSMVAKGTALSSPEVKKDVERLSALFSLDAFGGGFVSQSLLTYWFFLVYRV